MGFLDAVLGASFRKSRRLWSARRAARVTPEDAKVGASVRIVGRALPAANLLRAPFTASTAVLWATRADERRLVDVQDTFGNETGAERRWMHELDDHSREPFFVAGETGVRVRIELDHAEVVVPCPDVTSAPRFQSADVDPELDAYLRRNGYAPNGFMGIDGDHRFFEARVGPGDWVSAYGRVEESALVTSDGYRDAPARILRMVGTELEPVIILPA